MRPLDSLRGLLDGGSSGAGGGSGAVEERPQAAVADLGPDDFRRRADETAEEWNDLELDFTLASLERLEEFAAGQDGAFDRSGGEDGPMTGGEYVLDVGSYVGEVLANNFDGDWVDDDGWGVAVPVEGATATVGVFDVAARSFVEDPAFVEVAETLRAGATSAVADTGVSAGAARELGARAAAFADDWPAYDLDFSVASLARLDELVDAEPGLDDPADAGGLGAYLGQVFVREYGAEWRWTDESGWVVAVSDDEGGRAVLDVRVALRDCLSGAATFAAAHDDLLAELGLGDPELAARAAARQYRERAERLAADRPAALDFTVESLARLDGLVAGAGRGEDGDDALVAGTADERAEQLGAYFAEVMRRHHDAEWRLDGGEPVLVVAGEGASAELEPAAVAATALAGEAAFVDVYARLAAKIDLTTPLDDG